MKRDTSERGLNLVVSRQVKKGKQVIFGCRPYLRFLLQGSLNPKRNTHVKKPRRNWVDVGVGDVTYVRYICHGSGI